MRAPEPVSPVYLIQAVLDRVDLAETLAARIGPDARIVYDPDQEARLRSPWRTYRHAIETAPTDASHLVLIQDDATVCAGFRGAADAAVAACPNRVVVLCVCGNPGQHRLAVQEACHRGSSWVELGIAHFLPVIAVAWPAGVARDLVSWYDDQDFPEAFVADDEITSRYLRARGVRAVATVPSLVDHEDVVPSVMSRHQRHGTDPGRRAFLYVDRDCDMGAESIDWTSGLPAATVY